MGREMRQGDEAETWELREARIAYWKEPRLKERGSRYQDQEGKQFTKRSFMQGPKAKSGVVCQKRRDDRQPGTTNHRTSTKVGCTCPGVMLAPAQFSGGAMRP